MSLSDNFNGRGMNHHPVPTYIYTGCYTDWVQTLVTTISCPLGQPNGSLTCQFAGALTAGVHNQSSVQTLEVDPVAEFHTVLLVIGSGNF